MRGEGSATQPLSSLAWPKRWQCKRNAIGKAVALVLPHAPHVRRIAWVDSDVHRHKRRHTCEADCITRKQVWGHTPWLLKRSGVATQNTEREQHKTGNTAMQATQAGMSAHLPPSAAWRCRRRHPSQGRKRWWSRQLPSPPVLQKQLCSVARAAAQLPPAPHTAPRFERMAGRQ